MTTVLVLGGYGLIGAACVRALAQAGFYVRGLGRSRRAAMRANPQGDWVIRDLTVLTTADWASLLADVDVVVNAAGALQDGPSDDLQAIHATMPARLCAALRADMRVVQISAAGACSDASTAFLRSKAQGDAAIRNAPCPWVILRPALVLAPEAYGGTALLRGAAALPGVLPQVLPGSLVQTLHLDDLAAAVVAAVRGEVPSGMIADLAGPGAHLLPDLITAIRRWQGFPAARLRLPVPEVLMTATAKIADALGALGWRSPMRSTALEVLRNGVRADPSAWRRAGGAPPRGLEATLAALPATRQERLFARLYFALPLAIAILSLFWVASGLIALARPQTAAATLAGSGLPGPIIAAFVLGGALVDLALGLAILWRPWCQAAAMGMIAVAGAYLLGATMLTPALWADPLGPLVKVLPGMGLALIVAMWVEPR